MLFVLTMMLPFLKTSMSVKITEVNIPSIVEVGSENIILNCNYHFEDDEAQQLEIKWYFNKDPSPFFQWIAGLPGSKPQLIGSLFENKIDLDYMVDPHPYTRYRAIKIKNPSIDMAGTYHCKVSTLMSEEMANAHMLVYSPVTESSFASRRLDDSKVNVTCKFSGVFPLPNVKLTWGAFDLFADRMTAEVNPNSECYEVTIHKVLAHQELPAETTFGCEIEIPGTEYFVREEARYDQHVRAKRSVDFSILEHDLPGLTLNSTLFRIPDAYFAVGSSNNHLPFCICHLLCVVTFLWFR